MATFTSVPKHTDIDRRRMAIEELNRCRQYTDQLIGLVHNIPHGSSRRHPAADRLLSEVLYSITCALAVLDSRPQSTPSVGKENAAGGDGKGCSGKRKGSPLELEHKDSKNKRRDCFRSTSIDDRVFLATTNSQHMSPAVPRMSTVPYQPTNTVKAEPMPMEPEVILENSRILQDACVRDCAAISFNGEQLDCDWTLWEPGLSPSKIQNRPSVEQDQFPTLQASTSPCSEYDVTTLDFPPSSPSPIDFAFSDELFQEYSSPMDFDFSDELFQEYLSSWLFSP